MIPGGREIAAALRQIGRGFEALARALEGEHPTEPEARYLAALQEWGHRGLSRDEASTLLKKHGFAPQTAGAWARDDWIESRSDGLRYLTKRSHDWLAQREVSHELRVSDVFGGAPV
jgi:hypothetical protein